MPTFADLKKAVTAFTHRSEEAFIVEGFNSLERAINDAHIWAQRTHIFEHAKDYVTIPDVSLTNGADLSTAVLYGTTTAVQIRSLLRAWLPASDGSGQMPIGLFSRDAWVEARRRATDLGTYNNNPSQLTLSIDTGLPLSIISYGTKIHFSTKSTSILQGATTTDVDFDAVKWLPDYSLPGSTDFFLDYCFDFMTFRSVYHLNAFLKEDERIVVPAQLLTDSWTSVIRWDTSLLVHSTEDSHLE
jgi:hypothetical protein